jgi:hypothetical protein
MMRLRLPFLDCQPIILLEVTCAGRFNLLWVIDRVLGAEGT